MSLEEAEPAYHLAFTLINAMLIHEAVVAATVPVGVG
jgi:hypothetical protein